MTDTRKYIDEQFEKFFEFETPDQSTVASVSCKLFAEYCIQQLLAVIELQRQALQFYADGGHWDYNDTLTKETYLNDKGERATEALAIKPEDVELVESGYLDEFDNFEKSLKPWMQEEPNVTWQPVYTIKTKD